MADSAIKGINKERKDSMKKIIVSAVLAAMLPVSSVFAVSELDAKTDFANGTVSVSGKSEANKYVTIQVFKGGKTLADFNGSEAAAGAYSVFVGQKAAGSDGAFSFDFKYSGASETLNGYLTESGTSPEKFEIVFVNSAEYKALIDDLNNLAKADDKAAFVAKAMQSAAMLGADMEVYNLIDGGKAAEMFFNSVKKTGLNAEDTAKNSARFNGSIAAQALNENKLNSVSLILKSDLPSDLIEEIRQFATGAESEKYYISFARGKQISDAESFEKVQKEAMILTVAKYPQGFANLQKICEKYASFIGISTNYNAEAYKKVAGNGASSLSDLVSKLAAAAGTGGGSGGGGGSPSRTGKDSGKNSGGFVPVVSDGSEGGADIPKVTMPFEDMSSVGWAYTAVSTLADKGIISGKSETEFYPNDYITREEFVKIIVCASGADIIKDGTSAFSDVDSAKWYAPYVNTAHSLEVCRGISENEFGVGQNIKRQDAAVMVYNVLAKKNTFEAEKTDFNDYDQISDYAKEAVSKLAGAAIINGTDNSFRPGALLTRAEAAQIIYGSLNKF